MMRTKDITYVPDEEPEEPEEEENVPSSQPSSQSSQPSGKTHLEHVTPSLTSGIPQLPQKRKVAKEENKNYECKACPKKFQRTSELRDHNFTVHLKMTYDCAECLKCYQTKKALAHHNKTVHSGIGAVKCTQENCNWQSKEVGSLHQHLLEVHGIGEPIVCNVVTPSGQKCGKVFKIQGASRPMPFFICKGSLNVNCVTIILLHRNKLRPMLGSTTRRLKQEKSISVIYVGKYLTMN